MSRSAKRAPAPLFSELEENEKLIVQAPELLAGCLGSVLEAHARLIRLLADLPPGTAKALELERVRWSTERLNDQLSIALRAGRSAKNGNRELAVAQHAQLRP